MYTIGKCFDQYLKRNDVVTTHGGTHSTALVPLPLPLRLPFPLPPFPLPFETAIIASVLVILPLIG